MTFQVYNIPSRELGISVASFVTDFIEESESKNSPPTSTEMDSASFISWAFSHQGIHLPSTINNLLSVGYEVEIDNLQIGDLIFFSSEGFSIEHVGILTLEDTIVYVPKPGELPIEELIYPEFWTGVFVTARRVYKSEKIEYILEKMYQPEITQSLFKTYIESEEHNDDPGYLRFFTDDTSEKQLLLSENEDGSRIYGSEEHNKNVDQLEIKSGIIGRDVTQKRPLNKKKVEFVCIHDTGDLNMNAKTWNTVVTTYDTQTSWHFTIDHDEVYQHLPLDEWARHAGDGLGENPFQLIDTGVPFTADNPGIYFNEDDHHLYINGVKSELMAGKLDGEYVHGITKSGLYTEKGANGNYFINRYYVNSVYKVNSNSGGNTNSIGIESCVFRGIVYSKVMRRLSNLVAHLLHLYDLGTNRVLQHRHFSGKLCPQSMIRADEDTPFGYNQFKALVEINDFIVKQMPGVKFTYKSLTPDLLSDDGYLLKYVDVDTEVSYKVTVEFEGETVTKTYTTMVHPQIVNPEEDDEPEKLVLVLTSLYRRAGPSTEYEILEVLTAGTQVHVVGKENGWYKDVDGGYISSKLAYVEDLYGTVIMSSADILDEPNEGATVLASALANTRLQCLKKSNGWYYVKTKDGLKGWCNGSNLLF